MLRDCAADLAESDAKKFQKNTSKAVWWALKMLSAARNKRTPRPSVSNGGVPRDIVDTSRSAAEARFRLTARVCGQGAMAVATQLQELSRMSGIGESHNILHAIPKLVKEFARQRPKSSRPRTCEL